MSVVYGDPYYKPYYGPTGKVDFGWISEAWGIFKRDTGTWIAVTAVFGGIYFLLYMVLLVTRIMSLTSLSGGTGGSSSYQTGYMIGTYLYQNVFYLVLQAFSSAGLYGMALKAVRREPLTFSDGFKGGPQFLPLLGFYIVGGLFSLLGAFGLIIGMIFTSGLAFAGYAITCDGAGPVTALKESIRGMKTDWMTAGLFVLVLGLLLFVSIIPCYLGLLVTWPMYHICSALAYRDMVGMEGILEPPLPYGYQPPTPLPPSTGVWPPPPQSQTGYGQP